MEDDSDKFDIICLCCGSRNGKITDACSIHQFPLKEEDREKLPSWFAEQKFNYEKWFNSLLYRGSIFVPAGYELTDGHREAILRCTETYTNTHTGTLIYALPGCEKPGLISISQFFN